MRKELSTDLKTIGSEEIQMNKLSVIVLAAGKGTRMKSELPKVMHKLAGVPMIKIVLDKLGKFSVSNCYLVVGHGKALIESYISNKQFNFNAEFVWQKEQKGTAHAVLSCEKNIKSFNGDFLILCGDMPLVNEDSLREFYEYYKKDRTDIAVLSVEMPKPYGYGRIVRENGKFIRIVEEADASVKEKQIKEINTGIYIVKGDILFQLLKNIKSSNMQGEFYLTDIVEQGLKSNYKVEAFKFSNWEDFMGINNRIQLAAAESIIIKNKIENLAYQGVTFIKPETTYVELYVEIERDTVVYPGNNILNGTQIGSNCIIGPSNTIENTVIKDNVNIKGYCYLNGAVIDNFSQIGPFSHLRPKSSVGKDCKVGNFVEIKKSELLNGVKASHLSYIGDAVLNEGVNVGAGTITCNYDGFKKHKTEIGKNVFIGSDTQFVAPVKIGDNALIAAGSTVTRDVPENALVHSRTKQMNIKDKGMKHRK